METRREPWVANGCRGGRRLFGTHPQEKVRAVRLVRQLRKEPGTSHGTVRRVADQIGCGVESLRTWVQQADIDDGAEPGVSTADARRIRELEQENRELRRANDLPKRASAFFAAELCAHRGDRRVRRRAPRPVRSRVHLHAVAGGSEHLLREAAARRAVGSGRLWKAARRAGHQVGRDQVARLIAPAGHRGGVPVAPEGLHPPARTRARCAHQTWSTASSPPTDPAPRGSPI